MTSPARIALNAHLLSGEASYRSAGIHGYIYNTLAYLPGADENLSYIVFVGSGKPPHPTGARWEIHRSSLPTQHPLVRILWEQLAAPVRLSQTRPHLLHSMAFVLPVLWGGPSVVTVYDLSFLRYPERLSRSRRLYLQWATAASVRRARRVIAISESGRREISELLKVAMERIDVALPGVSENFRPLPLADVKRFRAETGLPERFILHLGTLEPRKNLGMLLRAYACLPQRDRVKLVLAGAKGWQTAEISSLIEGRGLAQDVILPGYISHETLPLWYNAADIFVYPSLYEGFGLPLLEAMACGAPVIASNTTSVPEAVGPAGVLLPPDEVGAWADAMSHLLGDRGLRAALAERGRERAKNFTWQNTARQTVAAYHRA